MRHKRSLFFYIHDNYSVELDRRALILFFTLLILVSNSGFSAAQDNAFSVQNSVAEKFKEFISVEATFSNFTINKMEAFPRDEAMRRLGYASNWHIYERAGRTGYAIMSDGTNSICEIKNGVVSHCFMGLGVSQSSVGCSTGVSGEVDKQNSNAELFELEGIIISCRTTVLWGTGLSGDGEVFFHLNDDELSYLGFLPRWERFSGWGSGGTLEFNVAAPSVIVQKSKFQRIVLRYCPTLSFSKEGIKKSLSVNCSSYQIKFEGEVAQLDFLSGGRDFKNELLSNVYQDAQAALQKMIEEMQNGSFDPGWRFEKITVHPDSAEEYCALVVNEPDLSFVYFPKLNYGNEYALNVVEFGGRDSAHSSASSGNSIFLIDGKKPTVARNLEGNDSEGTFEVIEFDREFFSRIASGNSMQVVRADGPSLRVSLKGSAKATKEFLRCTAVSLE